MSARLICSRTQPDAAANAAVAELWSERTSRMSADQNPNAVEPRNSASLASNSSSGWPSRVANEPLSSAPAAIASRMTVVSSEYTERKGPTSALMWRNQKISVPIAANPVKKIAAATGTSTRVDPAKSRVISRDAAASRRTDPTGTVRRRTKRSVHEPTSTFNSTARPSVARSPSCRMSA